MNSESMTRISPSNKKILNSTSILPNDSQDDQNNNNKSEHLQNFIYTNGLVSNTEFNENYNLVCQKCNKRYSSISGYNYHVSNFDHENPPKDYVPNKASKRGRPKGYRILNSLKTPKDEVTTENKDPVIRPEPLPRGRPRVHHDTPRPPIQNRTPTRRVVHGRGNGRKSRHRRGGYRGTSVRPVRRLTFEESQRLIEVEHNGSHHIVPLDDSMNIVFEDPSDEFVLPPTKKVENTLVAVFQETSEYNYEPDKNGEKNINTKDLYHYGNFQNFDENVTEYQIDEEDSVWLNMLKSKFKIFRDVKPEFFEYVMDRLEKDSEYIVKNTDGSAPLLGEEDVVCAVCLDGECSNNNAIVFCDICNIAVHQDCYGVPFVPEGPWVCRRCSHAPSKEIDCVLCPLKGGVLKQTVNGSWCHIICTILMPGAFFTNSVFLDAIDISAISNSRFKVQCKICKEIKGAVIQCSYNHCTTTFHGSCAQLNGWLTVEHVEAAALDENSLSQISHRYMPYCPRHFPPDKVSIRDIKLSKIAQHATSKLQKSSFVPPTIHVPVISDSMLNEISSNLAIHDAGKFVNIIKRYWQIKRYMRSGVPILKRRSFIPRNTTTPFKFTIEDLGNLENKEYLVEKCKRFQDYLQILLKLLKACRERERLKTKIDLVKKNIILKILDLQAFSEEISTQINSFFNKRFDFTRINSMSLSEIYQQEFNKLSFLTTKEFQKSIMHLLEKYILKFVSSKKVNNHISLLNKFFYDIFSSKAIVKDINGTQSLSKSRENHKNSENTSTYEHTPDKISQIKIDEDIKFVPTNPEAIRFIETLTTSLKLNHKKNEPAKYMNKLEPDSLVWAQLEQCKRFPAKIICSDSQENIKSIKNEKKDPSIINLEYFDKRKTRRSVNLNNIEPLGLSSSYDNIILNDILNSRTFGKDKKREIFLAYMEATSQIEGNSSYSKVAKSKT